LILARGTQIEMWKAGGDERPKASSTVSSPRAYRKFPGYEVSYVRYIMLLESLASTVSGESVYGPQLVSCQMERYSGGCSCVHRSTHAKIRHLNLHVET